MKRSRRHDRPSVPMPWRTGAALVAIAAGASCDAIVPVPRTSAPLNTCPCEGFGAAATCARRASGERCEMVGAASSIGRPDYPFWIVVHPSDTSSSDLGTAGGQTYVFFSDAQGKPAFETATALGTNKTCRPPLCLSVTVAQATSQYIVSEAASSSVGFPLAGGTTIPVRVVYESTLQTKVPGLPLSSLLVNSPVPGTRFVPYGPAFGAVFGSLPDYHRTFYPQPPFDAFFPPAAADISIKGNPFFDNFTLASIRVPGPTETANVTREDGLDGWRVWLVDRPSKRRISVVRTLSGTEAKDVPLFTTFDTLADEPVDAVVAPPESWTAVPRFVTPLLSGQGLGSLNYPQIPPPVTVTGVVAEPAPDGTLFGYPSTVSFESQTLATMSDKTPLLRYATTVQTDDRGRFATVLPPGRYAATTVPAEGTGYATTKVVVEVDRADTALTLRAPVRTLLKGRAVLLDGRPMAEADVIALPSDLQDAPPSDLVVPPRPARTRTGVDGRFTVDLDPGSYSLSVSPKPGTGFPRVVVRTVVPTSSITREVEVPDIAMPIPTRLAFTLKDSTRTEVPIARATVRIFARPGPGGGSGGSGADGGTGADAAGADAGSGSLETLGPVEIAVGVTDDEGAVELLLAQQPH